MPDARRNLRILDGLEPPDVWRDAETRVPRDDVLSDRPRRRGPAIVVALVVSIASMAFLIQAIGDDRTNELTSPRNATPSGTPTGAAVEYEASTIVLQDDQEPTMLCLGGILLSLPPQCGDIPIPNWDWADVTDEQRAGGVTWGEYHVVGTFDGASFTLTETPGTARPIVEQPDEIVTPCEEPGGGWPMPDPSNASDADLRRATNVAEREPDFSGAWIDGTPTVLTLAFTGDLDRHEADVRHEWGGPLCLWEFDRTHDELRAIQRELELATQELELLLLSSSVAVYRNQVDLGVVLADDDAIRELDRRYGAGVVKVTSALTPVA